MHSTHTFVSEIKHNPVFAAGFRLGMKVLVGALTVVTIALLGLLLIYVSMNGTLTLNASVVIVMVLVVPSITGSVLFAALDLLASKI